MMTQRLMNSVCARFFNGDDLKRPFRNANWRGAVLDRDQFSNARLPEMLWKALSGAANTGEVQICGYFLGQEKCMFVESGWDEFSTFMLKPENYSPEYIIFDASGRWAVWADTDVTTVAMDSELADLVDDHLKKSGKSLMKLTLENFSEQEIASSGGGYVRAVLGDLCRLKTAKKQDNDDIQD